MEYIQAINGQFVYRGENIRLRGFGIGTWLNLEHYMIGIPACENIIRGIFQKAYGKKDAETFFRNFQESFMTESDFIILKDCGVDFIRVPFNYRLFIDDNNPDTIKKQGFNLLDGLFKLCSKYQIFAMLDMHSAPGSQNPDWHSDNVTGIPLFWNYSLFRRQTTELWKAIAERYSNEQYLMGYDLLNEPAMANWEALNTFYRDTIREIRTVDKNHVIVLEGDNFSMDFSELEHISEDNIAIGFHYYPTVWSPCLLNITTSRETRNGKIREGLEKIIRQTKKFNWPVLCGEFGYAPKDCGSTELAMELLTDTLDLLEEYKISWLLWCYKDIGYMGMLAPSSNSEWKKLANEISSKWTQDIEKAQAKDILDTIINKWHPLISEYEQYLLQFRIRSFFFAVQGQQILLPQLLQIPKAEMQKMAFDFSGRNCIINDKINKIIKNILIAN